MIRTYALCALNGKCLALPLLTLKEAESARNALANMGKSVYIVNTKSE